MASLATPAVKSRPAMVPITMRKIGATTSALAPVKQLPAQQRLSTTKTAPVQSGSSSTALLPRATPPTFSRGVSSSHVPIAAPSQPPSSRSSSSSTTTSSSLSSSTPQHPSFSVGSTEVAALSPISPSPSASTSASTSAPDEKKLTQVLHQFVATALRNKAQKTDSRNYNQMIDQLSNPKLESSAVARWYTALSKCVSLIDGRGSRMSHLTSIIFGFDWFREQAPILAYSEFVVNLISAQGDFVVPTLTMLIKNLLPSQTTLNVSDSVMDTGHNAIHKTLSTILQLIPSAVTHVFPILVQTYPHKRHGVVVQQVYLKNLLRIFEYAPELRDRILEVIVDRMIQIDVEIRVLDEVEEEGESEEDEEGRDVEDRSDADEEEPQEMFRVDGINDKKKSQNTRSSSGSSDGKSMKKIVPNEEAKAEEDEPQDAEEKENGGATDDDPTKEMADKLDTMMLLMFHYLQMVKKAGNASLCDEVFASLLRVFERCILPTHKSKYVQFLLFYGCSLKHIYVETFLRRLMEKTFDPNNSMVSRQACASYISSFVARSAFLRHASGVVCFETMLDWAHAYVDYHYEHTVLLNGGTGGGGGSAGTDMMTTVGVAEAEHHAIFYAVCQAVFYIYCHRQDSFQEMSEQSGEGFEKYRFIHIIESNLNPLRFCLESVVHEFARLTSATGAVNCYPVLKRNQRLVLAPSAMGGRTVSRTRTDVEQNRGGNGTQQQQHVAGGGTTSALLLSYFPFDPYLLKLSSEFVTELYQTYQRHNHSPSHSTSQARPVPNSTSKSSPSHPLSVIITADDSSSASTSSPDVAAITPPTPQFSAMSLSLSESTAMPRSLKHGASSLVRQNSLTISHPPPPQQPHKPRAQDQEGLELLVSPVLSPANSSGSAEPSPILSPAYAPVSLNHHRQHRGGLPVLSLVAGGPDEDQDSDGDGDGSGYENEITMSSVQ